MAQDFKRYSSRGVGTSATPIFTADSNDTVVGISIANKTDNTITVRVYIGTEGTDEVYFIKDAPIPAGSTLQVLDGGAKFVVQTGDVLNVKSDTASSADVWVSTVDAISP